MKCPKCEGEMEEGMSVEYKSPGGLEMNINIPKQSTWGRGFKSGLFINSVDQEIPIKTYRCTQCGFLESYANGAIEDNRLIKKTIHNNS